MTFTTEDMLRELNKLLDPNRPMFPVKPSTLERVVGVSGRTRVDVDLAAGVSAVERDLEEGP
jgi:hypothetical protein